MKCVFFTWQVFALYWQNHMPNTNLDMEGLWAQLTFRNHVLHHKYELEDEIKAASHSGVWGGAEMMEADVERLLNFSSRLYLNHSLHLVN